MDKRNSYESELRAAERLLSRRDSHLRNLIKRYGPCGIRPHSRYFEALVASVISQQLSTRVADTIYYRFKALYRPARFPKPDQVLATPNEILRATGMSNGKVSFIKDLAVKTADGSLKFSRLGRMSDDEIIAMLTQVKGIGVWTVHMFLIFSLGRMDVLPVGDLGIRKAIQIAYGVAYGFDGLPSPQQIEQVAEERNWRPYCSIVSWYLWRSLQNKE